MRRWLLVVICLLIPVVARANPVVVNPASFIALGVVALSALTIEAGLVALILAFAGLAPFKVFVAFFLANVVVFIFVFCPLRHHMALPFLEALVIVIDAISIKLLSKVGSFQSESYRRVSWSFAGVTSLVGNAASFFVGVVASGFPL
jgi:hypothetical protein